MRAFVIDFKTLAALIVLVVSSFALADGVSYTYDSLGRITSATYANGAAFQYAYDANGNRTTLTVTPPAIQSQLIRFGTVPAVVVGGTGLLSATGGASGNPVTFTSSTTNVCTVSGSTVKGITAGTCTIAANQAGNANYNAAPQTTLSFNIGVATIPKVIVFASNRNGQDFEIYQKDLSSGIITNLTNNADNDYNPEISSDGRYVVFYSDRARDKNNNKLNQIYKLDLQNSNQVTRLTNDGASDYDPAFMPDGRILFKSNYNDGLGDIWIMNADGSNAQNLTPSLSQTEEWKPERISNTAIVFTSRLQQGNLNSDELFTLDIATGTLTRITTNNVPDWYPAVDSSGTKLAFVSKENQSDPDAIYAMNTVGQSRVKLTDPMVLPNDSNDPSWSPDGHSIVFVNSNSGNYDIYLMDNQGGNISPLELASNSVEYSPVFIPGSSPLAFNQLTVSNAGFGTVTSDVGTINCGTVCNQNYISGAGITLTATPQTGYTFGAWKGDCTGTAPICKLTMTAPKTVTVTFMANQAISFGAVPSLIVGGTITVSATGGASGIPVIFTSTTPGVCATGGTNGSIVTGKSVGTCRIAANQAGNNNYNAATQATLDLNITNGFSLTVSNGNIVAGSVTSDLGGIACGTTCSSGISSGATVKLTAVPVAGYQFSGWGRDCSGRGNFCILTMNAAKSVTGNFEVFNKRRSSWKRALLAQ
jgi:uncharacterized repeat protein (TIGR02543 family)